MSSIRLVRLSLLPAALPRFEFELSVAQQGRLNTVEIPLGSIPERLFSPEIDLLYGEDYRLAYHDHFKVESRAQVQRCALRRKLAEVCAKMNNLHRSQQAKEKERYNRLSAKYVDLPNSAEILAELGESHPRMLARLVKAETNFDHWRKTFVSELLSTWHLEPEVIPQWYVRLLESELNAFGFGASAWDNV